MVLPPNKPALVRTGRYLLVILVTLTIGYISSIPQMVGYRDVTVSQSNTITPGVQQIIRELGDEPLEVHAYTNLLGGFWYYGSPDAYNRNLAKWEPYMRFKHNIQLSNVRYYDTLNQSGDLKKMYPGKSFDQVVKQVADSRDMSPGEFKKPEEIRKIIDLSDEPDWYTMQLKYKGRTTFLRLFNDNEQWPTETEVAAALKRLLQAKMPKILFATGNLERDIYKMGDREYRALTNLKTFRYSLLNQGFDVDTLSLETSPVPAGITALVLADPKTALAPAAITHLQQYIDDGGNLMILGEPGKQALLNPLLQQFGVQLLDGTIVQESKDLQPELATPYLTEAAAALFPRLEHAHHDSARVSMPKATALSYTDTGAYAIQPLLVTNPGVAWLKKGKLVSDSAAIVFLPQEGDERRPFTTAVSLTRKVKGKEQRIVVAGDADFIGNAELQRFNVRTANFVFNTGLFSWLNYGAFPIDSSRPPAQDTRALVTKDQVKLISILCQWVLPGILLAFGTILLIRRKRK